MRHAQRGLGKYVLTPHLDELTEEDLEILGVGDGNLCTWR